jgi:FkbM family methyltransferase
MRKVAPAPVKRLLRSALVWKRRVQFHPYSITKTVEGESFPFLIGDATGKQWYEPDKDPVYRELAFIRDHMLAPDDLAFDVGSHHGLHTLVMARRSVRVVAIEPNPHNVAILKRNIALNGLQNVVVRQAAVGDSVGKVTLLQDSGEGGVLLQSEDRLPTIGVDLFPLDQLAEEYGYPQFLKIDVEGFEDRVLKGASRILRRCPKMMIEVHVDWVSRYGSSVREVVDLLNLASYRVWVLPYNLEQIRPWKGDNLTLYPGPKFTLFLMPQV